MAFIYGCIVGLFLHFILHKVRIKKNTVKEDTGIRGEHIKNPPKPR